MSNTIINWSDKIGKKYKTNKFGINKKLHIQNLFRGIIISPSNGGKTNLVFEIIASSPNIWTFAYYSKKS